MSGEKSHLALLRILGPIHVWALGVGIVLVGEFTGWNFSADKGGALAALTFVAGAAVGDVDLRAAAFEQDGLACLLGGGQRRAFNGNQCIDWN